MEERNLYLQNIICFKIYKIITQERSNLSHKNDFLFPIMEEYTKRLEEITTFDNLYQI